MKRNHYKTNKVKKGMKMMAVAALLAVLLAGCGQGNAEEHSVDQSGLKLT